MKLFGPEVKPLSGGKAKQLVIFLHGLGADGKDLITLAKDIGKFLPDAHFLSPHAPQECDMAPFGYQWFSLQQRDEDSILKGIKATAPILNNYIDEQLVKLDIKPENVILMGFSQGTMMSLYVALRRERAIGGIVGFSGALIGAQSLPVEIKSTPPVLLIHGDNDDVVPYQALAFAKDTLSSNNVKVETLTCKGLGHSIDIDGIEEAIKFMRDKFYKLSSV
jgi:phospholipase/carboxylesterase